MLAEVSRNRTFWILAGTFFICGLSTNGLVQTHFISLCGDNGLGIVPAAVWWNDSRVLSVALLVFVAAYITLYRRIVRFKSPRWMKARRADAPAL